jgi:hypothetical protein
MLVGITIIFYFCTEIILSTPGFSVAISKDGFKLSCKLLPFASNNTVNYDGPYKFFTPKQKEFRICFLFIISWLMNL